MQGRTPTGPGLIAARISPLCTYFITIRAVDRREHFSRIRAVKLESLHGGYRVVSPPASPAGLENNGHKRGKGEEKRRGRKHAARQRATSAPHRPVRTKNGRVQEVKLDQTPTSNAICFT